MSTENRVRREDGRLCYFALTLALTASRPANQACLHRWDPLIWVLLPVELFDLRCLDKSHVTAAAAVLAVAAPPTVLANTAAAAILAIPALPPVLADATAAAVLALLRRRPCSQKLLPPQSLHWLRRRPCSQMPLPPQSLH